MVRAIVLAILVAVNLFTPAIADDKKDTNALFEKKSDKERIYKVPIETMWKACMKAAAEENVIDYSNEKEGIITYKSGMSMASWGFRISVNLTKLEDGRTRLKLTTQKTERQLVAWGAGGRTAGKFFKGLDRQLAEMKPDSMPQQ
jgi:hypothetical protein